MLSISFRVLKIWIRVPDLPLTSCGNLDDNLTLPVSSFVCEMGITTVPVSWGCELMQVNSCGSAWRLVNLPELTDKICVCPLAVGACPHFYRLISSLGFSSLIIICISGLLSYLEFNERAKLFFLCKTADPHL